MPTIASLLAAATAKTLSVADCVDILKASEGVRANALWTAEGHPLQHSASEPGAPGFRSLDADYHFRGPIPIEKEVLAGGPNVGKAKAAIKIEADGSFTPKSNTFHSQFQDDNQAGTCLKLALESKAGLWALALLQANARLSITVAVGTPGGTQFFSRASHLVGAGIPTSNIISPAEMNSNYNFVLIDRKDMGAVVATLRAKDSPVGHLHVQTLYPTGDAMPAGSSSAEVSAKSATDYAGPATAQFT